MRLPVQSVPYQAILYIMPQVPSEAFGQALIERFTLFFEKRNFFIALDFNCYTVPRSLQEAGTLLYFSFVNDSRTLAMKQLSVL